MEKENLNIKEEIKSFLTKNFSFDIILHYLISENKSYIKSSNFIKDENLIKFITNLINNKFSDYFKINNNLSNDNQNYDFFFIILNYLYIFNENKLIYSISLKLSEPFKNYSLIYFYALTKKYDFYLSEINNLILKDNLIDWIKLFHIFFTYSNNLKVKISPKFLLLKDKNIKLNNEIINSFSDFIISNFKFGTLYYYINEFESFRKVKNEENLKKLLFISCNLNKEEINIELSKNKNIKFFVIELLEKIVKEESLSKIEKNFEYILYPDKNLIEFDLLDDNYLFPNNKYFLFKSKLLKSKDLLHNKQEINNLKKIILNFIYNDPGYEPFYSILLYFYSIINEKENFYTLYEKYKNLFNFSFIQNESIINLCKSFFILKDYDNCKNILKFYKGKLPELLIKINRIIQN